MSSQHASLLGRFVSLCLAVFLALVLATTSMLLGPLHQARAADSPDGTPLLLVHGYQDSCTGAFDTEQDTTATHPATLTYLEDHGWPSTSLYQVGYYNNNIDSGCTASIQGVKTSTGQLACQLLSAGSSKDGTLDDPIQHLGCLLAWYIYDQFTQQGIAVNILAHSMGGLIVRDAIGQTFSNGNPNYNVNFPSHPLLVKRVVTVATPHGGEGGFYHEIANQMAPSQEVNDMNPGSTFMNLMGTIQKPQGQNGTFWGLIAAADLAAPPSGDPQVCPLSGYPAGAIISCFALLSQPTVQYPDGDGIVQTESMLAMAADYKVLYGAMNVPTATQDIADTQTEYEHETQSCHNFGGSLGYRCLDAPFYLNDGAPDNQLTKAWICTSNCNATDFSDMNLGNGTAQPVFHSLAEIAWLLAPSTHTNTGQVTYVMPSLATFNSRLYVCWVDTTGALYIVSTSDGVHFSSPTRLAGNSSNDGCSLAGFNNNLYLAYTGTDKHLNVEYGSTGTSFPNQVVLSDTSEGNPALASFNSRLYLAWTGTDGLSSGHLNLNSLSSGLAFNNKNILQDTSNKFSGPALNGFNGYLYVAWQGTDTGSHLNVGAYLSGTSFAQKFTFNIQGNTQSTPATPALTHVNGQLDLGWLGMDSIGHLNVESSTTGVFGFGNQDTLADTASNSPALAALNSQLIWAWSGTNTPPNLNVAAEY